MDPFLKDLKAFRKKWQKWLLRCLGLAFTGRVVLIITWLCWLDYFFAFPSIIRIVLDCLLLFGVLSWLGIHLAGIFKISARDSAIKADQLLKSRRREILSALEMGQCQARMSRLSAYLAATGIDSARKRLRSIRNIRPTSLLKKNSLFLGICLIIAFVPAMFNSGAIKILMARVFFPNADIPPYSAYEFNISPKIPKVIYGNDQVIHLKVTGKRVGQPVRFATRNESHIIESACFQAGPDEFVQRLENVMQPLEFCFRIGKAQSRWHRLEVLFQPYVQSASVRIMPPAYTKQPPKEFNLGADALKGVTGTKVELTLTSNRPLRSGELTLTPIDIKSHARTIAGRVNGPKEIVYQWEIDTNARLVFMINDILGTPAKEPVKVLQQLVLDKAPVAVLSEPMTLCLATPSIKVPIYASIEDDYGIKRADLYRSLKGFRSRAMSLELDGDANRYDVKQELDLAKLGVEPGQVIELFVEAVDTNPELTGVGESEISRIQIISDEEYARMVRAKVTISAFEKRFLMVSQAYDALLKQLEKAETDLKTGHLTQDQAQKQLEALQAKIKATATSIREVAHEFAAFDLEKALAQSAAKLADALEKALQHPGFDSKA